MAALSQATMIGAARTALNFSQDFDWRKRTSHRGQNEHKASHWLGTADLGSSTLTKERSFRRLYANLSIRIECGGTGLQMPCLRLYIGDRAPASDTTAVGSMRQLDVHMRAYGGGYMRLHVGMFA